MQTIDIQGRYTTARIYATDDPETGIDQYAVAQVRQLCDSPAAEGSTIRVMPDFHPGKGCVIGLTMSIAGKVVPNLVGVDIGCGVLAAKIGNCKPDFKKLDRTIREKVPAGFRINDKPHHDFAASRLDELVCAKHIDLDRAAKSLGSLGGGNHFIELASNGEGETWLVVHSGSRHAGLEVCNWYARLAQEGLKAKGIKDVPYELSWLEGQQKDDYLHDMFIMSDFASLNRETMIRAIMRGMKWEIADTVESVHNYIAEDNVIRKGAIRAGKDRLIIPVNMRDGSILGTGKANPDWNNSAPHGAGRICSRNKIKGMVTLPQFKAAMDGIWSSSINKDTIDESPFAYRDLADIQAAVQDTVEVEQIIRPVYSFKAGSKG